MRVGETTQGPWVNMHARWDGTRPRIFPSHGVDTFVAPRIQSDKASAGPRAHTGTSSCVLNPPPPNLTFRVPCKYLVSLFGDRPALIHGCGLAVPRLSGARRCRPTLHTELRHVAFGARRIQIVTVQMSKASWCFRVAWKHPSSKHVCTILLSKLPPQTPK